MVGVARSRLTASRRLTVGSAHDWRDSQQPRASRPKRAARRTPPGLTGHRHVPLKASRPMSFNPAADGAGPRICGGALTQPSPTSAGSPRVATCSRSQRRMKSWQTPPRSSRALSSVKTAQAACCPALAHAAQPEFLRPTPTFPGRPVLAFPNSANGPYGPICTKRRRKVLQRQSYWTTPAVATIAARKPRRGSPRRGRR